MWDYKLTPAIRSGSSDPFNKNSLIFLKFSPLGLKDLRRKSHLHVKSRQDDLAWTAATLELPRTPVFHAAAEFADFCRLIDVRCRKSTNLLRQASVHPAFEEQVVSHNPVVIYE